MILNLRDMFIYYMGITWYITSKIPDNAEEIELFQTDYEYKFYIVNQGTESAEFYAVRRIDDMEEWRTIPDCPNYEASSGGRIRNKNTHRVLAQYKAITGYMTIRLSGCNWYVHRLVCQAFHPCERYKQYHCDHINHDKTDNRASNLRWLTREENIRNQIHKKKDPN